MWSKRVMVAAILLVSEWLYFANIWSGTFFVFVFRLLSLLLHVHTLTSSSLLLLGKFGSIKRAGCRKDVCCHLRFREPFSCLWWTVPWYDPGIIGVYGMYYMVAVRASFPCSTHRAEEREKERPRGIIVWGNAYFNIMYIQQTRCTSGIISSLFTILFRHCWRERRELASRSMYLFGWRDIAAAVAAVRWGWGEQETMYDC